MHIRPVPALLTLAAALALALPAQAELNAYLSVKGQKQGDIKGSVTQKGREGRIMVIAMDHTVMSPTDPASGLATGRTMHKPLTIIKEIDRSSPLLHNALSSNENLTDVVLEFWQPPKVGTGSGAEVQYYTIALKNARVTGIHQVMPNNKNPDLARYAAYEEVAFTYDSITWTWTDGGITAGDNWNARH